MGMAVGIAVGYAREMRVRMLYFGVLREMLGGGEALLEVADGAIVADVLNVYRERIPAFAWDSIAVAVNREYARPGDGLKDGDEVALLPPVSGGREGAGRDAD
jgi:molybdopterin converting factor small subunit